MIIATTPFVAGHRVVETKGQVFGLVVRSRGLGGNLIAGLRSIGGGEIHEYTSLLEDTRRQAIDRMVQNATLVGAQRRHLDALRQLRAGRDDVRDRGLRDRGRRRARRWRATPARSSSRWASTIARGLIGGIGVLLRPRRRSRSWPSRGPAATCSAALSLFVPGVLVIIGA